MPIVNLPSNPPVPETPVREPIQLTDVGYKHNLIDASVTPLSAMITHIEGSTWPGDYYSQILAGSEEVSPFQLGQMPPYQQYHEIKNCQLKLQGGLSNSVDGESGVMTMTGTALVYPCMRPNLGDAFLADIGDGRLGQFTVSSPPVPKTIFKETTYEIQLTLTRFADAELVDAIRKRVVKTSYFVSDFLVYGQNPIISAEALASKELFERKLKELRNLWLKMFYSTEFKTIAVPGQASACYDPYITRAFLDIHDQSDHPLISKIKVLNCDGIDEAHQTSIWDVLLKQDSTLLYTAFKTPTLTSVSNFHWMPHFESIQYSGLSNVVVSALESATVDRDYSSQVPITGHLYRDLMDMQIDIASTIYLNSFDEFHYPDEDVLSPESFYLDTEVPLIHPIANHGGYVLSKGFYDEDVEQMSKLEILVKQYVDTEGIVNLTVLMAFCNSAKEWGRLEKFYYIPVLMILLISSLRRI